MSDLVGKPDDLFSRVAAHILRPQPFFLKNLSINMFTKTFTFDQNYFTAL